MDKIQELLLIRRHIIGLIKAIEKLLQEVKQEK